MQAMGRMRIHGVGQYELRQNKEEETEKEMEHGKWKVLQHEELREEDNW
jgi:hypothetical protein